MSGSASYNSSNNQIPNLNDVVNEWTNPSATAGQLREAIVGGTANARQVAMHANWSGIVTLTDKIRIVDSVNYDNWRNSGNFNQVTTNLFASIPAGGRSDRHPAAHRAVCAAGFQRSDVCQHLPGALHGHDLPATWHGLRA